MFYLIKRIILFRWNKFIVFFK